MGKGVYYSQTIKQSFNRSGGRIRGSRDAKAIRGGPAPRDGERNGAMKKTYKIDVDCANCANKMEDAANRTDGVKEAVVNFMTLKMKVEFEEGAEPARVMEEVRANCKRVEDDCEIFL